MSEITYPGSKYATMTKFKSTLDTKASSYTVLPASLGPPVVVSGVSVITVPQHATMAVVNIYGDNDNNETVIGKLVGFRSHIVSATSTLYLPLLLCSFTATYGIAATILGTNYFLADTIATAAQTPTDPGIAAVDSIEDSLHPAEIRVDLQGCGTLAFYDYMGTAAGVGAFVGFI
jgi:hypothetical protein